MQLPLLTAQLRVRTDDIDSGGHLLHRQRQHRTGGQAPFFVSGAQLLTAAGVDDAAEATQTCGAEHLGQCSAEV